MTPRLLKFNIADNSRQVAYAEWGDSANPRVLICVHGLTLNGRDFDRIGAALAPHYRVICPDIAGRGRSDWLTDPAQYHVGTYVQDMIQLMAHLGLQQVDWLGTSMGGLIGMFLADTIPGSIRRLILNDVGPYIPAASLRALAQKEREMEFANLEDGEAALREGLAEFGIVEDRNWHHLTEHFFVPLGDGRFRVHYDPAIISGTFQADFSKIEDFDGWAVWDRLQLQDVLCIRGEKSDILSAETALRMKQTGPMAHVVTLPGIGHAPGLLEDDQVAVVRGWLVQS